MTIIPLSSYKAANWMYENYWLVIVACVLAIVVECALICVRSLARKVPTNYILLFLFTICEAYTVAFICAASDPKIVLAAAFMTAAMVISLTVYAFVTKTDFTVLGGLFFILGACLTMFCIFAFIVRYHVLNMAICAIGVVLFGLYLIFDTQLIMGGKRYQLDIDEYIVGALILYIDIIMIFLYLLRLLSNDR